ncbi:MAG: hypothetical protein H6737_02755 [Alphaproteobacteria bacterium]|nr:hypothetical protein [Alphaproteobacteria bacterium]
MILAMMAAFAADPEAERISEALLQSVKEGEWRAVERRYLELVRDHPAGLDGLIHQTGAQAARQRGELLLASQRLLRVRETETGYRHAAADLDLFREQTGLVMLHVAEPGPLKAATMPFLPDMRLAIENASAALESTGYYVGLLPVGEYTLGPRTFEVTPGFDWHVVDAM